MITKTASLWTLGRAALKGVRPALRRGATTVGKDLKHPLTLTLGAYNVASGADSLTNTAGTFAGGAAGYTAGSALAKKLPFKSPRMKGLAALFGGIMGGGVGSDAAKKLTSKAPGVYARRPLPPAQSIYRPPQARPAAPKGYTQY